MIRYKNLGGDSGVYSYEIGDSWIRIKFSDGSVYLYTSSKPGVSEVNKMKQLAEAGQGLNEYINRYIRKNFERKEK